MTEYCDCKKVRKVRKLEKHNDEKNRYNTPQIQKKHHQQHQPLVVVKVNTIAIEEEESICW